MEKQQCIGICADGPGSINNCPYVVCRKSWGLFPHVVKSRNVDANGVTIAEKERIYVDISRWKCFCTKSGKEEFVGCIEPYISCQAPEGCTENC